MSDEWTDMIAGARMRVDEKFQPRIQESRFSNQQWGLIMTAVEFDIHQPDDPENAELIADSEKLPEIIPELEEIQQKMGRGRPPMESSGSGGGLFDKLKDFFDVQSEPSDKMEQERLTAAQQLVEEYTRHLQSYLEEQDRWEDVRQAALDS